MEKQSEKVVLNIHAKMALIKSELAEFEIKRSGKNKHQNFEYLELKDFMPYILKLNAKYGINSVFNRDIEKAKLVLYDTESDQKIKFKMLYFLKLTFTSFFEKNKFMHIQFKHYGQLSL